MQAWQPAGQRMIPAPGAGSPPPAGRPRSGPGPLCRVRPPSTSPAPPSRPASWRCQRRLLCRACRGAGADPPGQHLGARLWARGNAHELATGAHDHGHGPLVRG
jgi:hypothetical protein